MQVTRFVCHVGHEALLVMQVTSRCLSCESRGIVCHVGHKGLSVMYHVVHKGLFVMLVTRAKVPNCLCHICKSQGDICHAGHKVLNIMQVTKELANVAKVASPFNFCCLTRDTCQPKVLNYPIVIDNIVVSKLMTVKNLVEERCLCRDLNIINLQTLIHCKPVSLFQFFEFSCLKIIHQ